MARFSLRGSSNWTVESERLRNCLDLILDQMGTFLCIECGKSFEEEAFLYIHQNRTHDKTVRSCEKCGENFVGKVALQNHKRKHNNAVAKMKAMMKCEICPYETT